MREATRRWGPPIIWMALSFVLSAQPGLAVSEDPSIDLPIRRAAHVIAYAVLTILFARALGAGTSLPRLALATILAAVYGVTDELHQSLVPDRTGRAEDVLIDAIGALVGAVLFRSGQHIAARAGLSARSRRGV